MSNFDPYSDLKDRMNAESLKKEAARLESLRQQRLNPPTPKRFQTAKEIHDLVNARHIAALMRESSNRSADIREQESQPLAEEAVNPYKHLSTEEIYALDELTRQEATQKREMELQLTSMASWLLRNPSFPATEAAANTLATFCRVRGLSLSHDNLSAGWADLQRTQTLRPNYSEANSVALRQNVEQLRGMGYQVQEVPNMETCTGEELASWMRDNQPPPTLANLQPPIQHDDPFALSLDEWNHQNQEPEYKPWD
jgi:hypothetical protein